MLSYFFALFTLSVTAAYYRLPFWLLSVLWFLTPFVFYKLKFITNTQGIITLFLLLNAMALINIRPIRRWLVTIPMLHGLNNKDQNAWRKFSRIDDGWLTTKFEKNLFNGNPDFKTALLHSPATSQKVKQLFNAIEKQTTTTASAFPEYLASLGLQGILTPEQYDGLGLTPYECTQVIERIASHEPLLGAAVGILSCESAITLINHHGSKEQKRQYLPAFAQAEKQVFLNPTFLYELLENNQSSIEGRIDSEVHDNKTIHGIRLSFDDVIVMGTNKSSVFYLAIHVTDFTNELSKKTKLGTALCLFDTERDDIKVRHGNPTFKGLFQYYHLSADNIFIPLSQIIGGFGAVNQGIKQLYQLQSFAAGIWPAAVSLPIHRSGTLISWHFSHIKKQNSRALLDYRLVKKQLIRQFSHSQRLKLLNQMAMSGNNKNMSYSHILFKNSILDASLDQLTWLRTILGSHAHNIKGENNLNQYFRIKHLSMELDGDSHEINQLPLMKKVALSSHPWYAKEIALMSEPKVDPKLLDRYLFKHMGWVMHQLAKVWVYAVRTSWFGRLFWRRKKRQNFIKRISASYAFIADLALIKWSLKKDSNTEFTGYLATCNQHLLMLMVLIQAYEQQSDNPAEKWLLKQSLKDSFYLSQRALNQCINSAFSRFGALALKVMIFPFGKPFHQASFSPKGDYDLSQVEANGNKPHSILQQIADASKQLSAVQSIEHAVSNATGTALTTKNHQVLINRTLAAGIISVEQAEQIRAAYDAILNIQLINHFGNKDETQEN
ncbi:acyl-CoA dehydrogenase domain-containing protein [Marinicella rhabdoformis]|uniref:acyl-CoA dehydrogenase domain-containing protein n=1 Tax=Marinicella rhabdoformis TaxID=2580566 RepID=UPI0012AEC0DB|nr:acyl-CoA dehydrogenase domain-containing protein [Marinicella rhabdoformis]